MELKYLKCWCHWKYQINIAKKGEHKESSCYIDINQDCLNAKIQHKQYQSNDYIVKSVMRYVVDLVGAIKCLKNKPNCLLTMSSLNNHQLHLNYQQNKKITKHLNHSHDINNDKYLIMNNHVLIVMNLNCNWINQVLSMTWWPWHDAGVIGYHDLTNIPLVVDGKHWLVVVVELSKSKYWNFLRYTTAAAHNQFQLDHLLSFRDERKNCLF